MTGVLLTFGLYVLFLRMIDVFVWRGSIDGVEPYLADELDKDEEFCAYSCCLLCWWPLPCKLLVDPVVVVDDLSIEGNADGWSMPLKLRVFHESRRDVLLLLHLIMMILTLMMSHETIEIVLLILFSENWDYSVASTLA